MIWIWVSIAFVGGMAYALWRIGRYLETRTKIARGTPIIIFVSAEGDTVHKFCIDDQQLCRMELLIENALEDENNELRFMRT